MKYWKGIEELQQDPAFVKNAANEFPEALPSGENGAESDEITGTHRRDFLKLLGFGVAAASLAACEAPVRKAIPYLNKPEDIDPSVANWYASTYFDGSNYASVFVKTREGRPIKIEGNKYSTVSRGGVNALVQASVLSLYDNERAKGSLKAGKAISWSDTDKEIKAKLEEIALKGGQIRIVTSTIISPSTLQVLNDFTAKYPTTKVVTVDTASAYGILQANNISFGKYALPSYDFSKADVIVSLGADFLGTWLSPIEYAKQYANNRKVGKDKKTMSRHYQFESALSLTGSNADHRTPIKPSQLGLVATKLLSLVTGNALTTPNVDVANLDKAAKDLKAAAGKSLVVSSSNDPNVQLIVNAINAHLGNYGTTIDINNHANYRKGNDTTFTAFVNDVANGSVDAVFFYNTNPLYNHPLAAKLKASLKKVSLKVSFADRLDETASEVDYLAPDHHFLESWNDAEPVKGKFSVTQPTISALFKTRQAQESFLAWAGVKTEYYLYLQNYWKANLFSSQSAYASFIEFWNRSLHDGIYEISSTNVAATPSVDIAAVSSAIASTYKAASNDLEVVLYEKIGIGNGSQANNPWLQELPDPISKATWDNYLAVPFSLAKEKGFKQNDIVKLQVNGLTEVIELPVIIQPGQAKGTVSVALGYGRTKAGKSANGVGKNVYSLIANTSNGLAYSNIATITATGTTRQLAQTQIHHTIMGRAHVQESVLSDYSKKNGVEKDGKVVGDMAGRVVPMIAVAEGGNKDGKKAPEQISIWSKKPNPDIPANHHWGMVIDLNSCIGCSACVIGCQAENNIPVVGRQEIINAREMHWMRIDRYYTSAMNEEEAEKSHLNVVDKFKQMEEPEENPRVVFQPMMCQHCNNAPCETVCPVLATTHSTEGLNQMAYNRCIGTRYCANNCPYKVRRFNWFSYLNNSSFDYNMNNALGRMVLNPDVTVRARGVMEKCSMCVQRIQEGKLNAKKENRRPEDGEIETACSQSCPTDAIVFGDMLDPNSEIAKLLAKEKEGRVYHALEEVNVNPSVSYLSKIRNTNV